MIGRGNAGRRILLLVLLGLLTGARQAEAQVAGGLGTSTALPSGRGVPSAANAYVNPYPYYYLNPYLNPYGVDRTDALLWALAQPRLGRPGQEAPAQPAPAARAAEMPRTLMVPGGGAAGYFQRGAAVSPSDVYATGRHNRYFGNNGRSGARR